MKRIAKVLIAVVIVLVTAEGCLLLYYLSSWLTFPM